MAIFQKMELLLNQTRFLKDIPCKFINKLLGSLLAIFTLTFLNQRPFKQLAVQDL